MRPGGLHAERWNAEYRAGRYRGEAALPFVDDILATLRAHPAAMRGIGLYVGCGNGRNYVPLVNAGLDMLGLDVADEALRQLAARRPEHAHRLICSDFCDFQSDTPLAYVVALQVLQHGTEVDIDKAFAHVRTLLASGGLFFLRVNSIATEIHYQHTVLERNAWGGFTIRYNEGPKRDLPVHFYSREELLHRLTEDFEPLMALRHDTIEREAPLTGTWSQWEGIWRRRSSRPAA